MCLCVRPCSRRRFYSRLLELRRRIKANSLPLLAASSLTPIVSGGSNSVGEDVNGGGPTTPSTNTIHSTNNRSRVEQTLQPDDDLEPVVLRVKRYHAGRPGTLSKHSYFLILYTLEPHGSLGFVFISFLFTSFFFRCFVILCTNFLKFVFVFLPIVVGWERNAPSSRRQRPLWSYRSPTCRVRPISPYAGIIAIWKMIIF